MTITEIKHEQVNKDGTFKNQRGAITTTGAVLTGRGEGCGLENCNCSPGYWHTILLPLNDKGIVHGVKFNFDDEAELNLFLKTVRK